MANDEIIIPFSAGVASYEKAINEVEQRTLGLADAAEIADKAFNRIGKDAAKGVGKQLREVNRELTNTQKSAKDAGRELENTSKKSQGGFLKLRNELKSLKGQMAELVVAGKEGSAEFKKLQIQAGALQDQMKDLGTSIAQNAGDPLENLSGTVGSLQGSFASLDFDGVSRGLSSLATNVGRVDLKTFKDGIGGVVQGFGKLAASILTNPLFLVAGAVAGIIAAISAWGDSLDEIREKNERLIAGIDRRLSVVEAGYDAEIKRAEAAGKLTDDLEKKKLQAVIKATRRKIELREKEYQYEVKNADAVARILGKKFTNEIIDASETNKTLTDLRNQLTLAEADFDSIDIAANKKKEDEKIAKAKESSEKYKKILEDRQKKIFDKANENFNASVFKAQQEEAQTLETGQKKIQEIIDKANGIQVEKRKTLEDDLRPIRIQNLKNVIDDEKRSFEERQTALEEALDKQYITEKEYTDKSKQLVLDRIAANNSEIQSKIAFANNIIEIGSSLNTLLTQNQEEAAERNKLFAAFGVGLNLASSLSNMIAGAAIAAKDTGPLAPFTLVSYIASGTALVLGAFAQIKTLLDQPVPKGAAHGEEWVQGRQYGKDTEHYMLAHGERVVTSAVNNKYWDDLHAMHTGKYEKYIHEKRVLPALRKALGAKMDLQNESFASNIANSLLLNQGNWKGANIVKALAGVNESEGKRHKELINVMRSRSQYRKK